MRPVRLATLAALPTCHRAAQSAAPNAPYYPGDAQLVYTEAEVYGGPFSDSMSPAHATQLDEGLDDPRFCGQCHQVTNPDVHLAEDAPTGATALLLVAASFRRRRR